MKRYIKSGSSTKLPKVKSAEASYTGGGWYVFLGEFSDGTYFIADYPYWDLRIVNEDPRPTFWGDDYDTDAGYEPWQNAHLIKDLDGTDTEKFFDEMFKWILKNNPEGNYNSGDIEELMAKNADRDSDSSVY